MKISKPNIIAAACLIFVVVFAIFSTVCFSNFGGDWEVRKVFGEISSTDNTLIELDTAINESISNEDLYLDIDNLNETKDKLENIDTNTDNALCTEYANQAVKCRIQMINYGMQIYDSAKYASEIITAINECNDLISKSDSLLQESNDILLENRVDKFDEALNKSKEAKEHLEQVTPKLDYVSESNYNLDLSTYYDYTKIKLDAINHGIALCKGVIDNNVEFVQNEIQVYISLNQQASQKASNLNFNPRDIVRVKFDLENKSLIDQYKQARKEAAENDSVIRNYLGK